MRTVTVALVAALVVLSGCSGLLPNGGTADGGPGSGNGGGSPTGSAYAAGYAESGVTNATRAVESHRSALLNTSGFAVTYGATVNTADGSTTVDYVQRVETGSKEVLTRTNISGGGAVGNLSQYFANGTLYQRSSSPATGGVRYGNRSASYNLSSYTGTRLVRPVVSDVTYGASEVVTYQGDRAVRYTNATLENATSLLGRDVNPENVTSFDATLVVDASGIVRHVEYTATVEANGTRTIDVTVDVRPGGVTVDRPSWVAKA